MPAKYSYCLRVAVSVPVKNSFLYSVPERLATIADVGLRVSVPFKKRIVTGYILEKIPQSDAQDLKEIIEILDTEPLFDEKLVPLFYWMADYYVYPLGQVIQSALPGGLNPGSFLTATLTEKGMAALKYLPPYAEEKNLLNWVQSNPNKRLPGPVSRFYGLERKRFLVIKEKSRKISSKLLQKKYIKPKKNIDLQTLLQRIEKPLKAKNEIAFLETAFGNHSILLSELSSKFSNGAYLTNKWIKKGALEVFSKTVFRNPSGEIIVASPVPTKLYKQQREAFDHIRSSLDRGKFSVCLLFGITGSGKTEVYYRAVEHAIGLGRQAIVMVPEIALAVYMEGLLRSRLGDRVTTYHSGLSKGERYDQWRRIAKGDVDLVIGARSALFAPFNRLGLIVVDEEHDTAYKQERGLRYQARDAAVVRAKMEKALVVLGSGTPSIQSYQNCLNKRYHLVSMPHRIEKRPLPEVQIVNMKSDDKDSSEWEILSPKLKQALSENLEAGNQTLMFLNRRGFHRLFLCRACGKSIQCPNCDVALTHHFSKNILVCHYCGFSLDTKTKCPTCGHAKLKPYGFGTEKLEKDLETLYPDARIARLDSDTTRKKGRSFSILKKFSSHEIDVLVGTQMITKGFDFPRVTLVGIVAADLSLAFPDFRAGERTFQLLSQVAGRAGRGEQKGRVIIQTFNPDHYAISTAMAHDFSSFFKKEKKLRRQLMYPPFSHLACLRLQGNSEEKALKGSEFLGQSMRDILSKWPKRGKEIQVMGPVEAPLSRLKGKYRWQIFIKSENSSLLNIFLSRVDEIFRRSLQTKGVHLTLDLDPYQML